MPRCTATVSTPSRPNTGDQCRRMACRGAEHCERHGGVEETTTPEALKTRPWQPAQKCVADKRDGSPCNNYAIRGGSVCRKHGGSLPNVQMAARNRMLELVPLAVRELRGVLERPGTSDADRIRAISLLLDRTGLGAKSEVSLEVKKYEAVMDDILRLVPEGMPQPEVWPITPAALPVGAALSDRSDLADGEDERPDPPAVLADWRFAKSRANPPTRFR